MSKKTIVGLLLAMGILTVGALSASAAEPCGKCTEKQVVQQFNQETGGLTSALKAKEIELRQQYSYDSIDTHKVEALEAELKELKDGIIAAAQKHGIADCCRS